MFLSYAREDSAAAKRLCEALREAGIEVWFDQHELQGGDAWDAKIKKQIRECALFVPLISAQTEVRAEAYFRREWNLAVDRAFDMAHDTTFILPVAIDDTQEATARVPDKFCSVQWTRLPGGVAEPRFIERVRTLLDGPVVPAPRPRGSASRAPLPPPAARRKSPAWLPFAAAGALAAAGIWFWQTRSPVPPKPSQADGPAPTRESVISPRFIAVLPFDNLSEDRENTKVFAEGMHDEVITALGKVAALTVIGRTSVLPYADPKQRNLKKIAADLGVGTVVEGTVSRVGDEVRIAVELVEAQTSRQLWKETYVRKLNDIFALQAAIAQEVAGRLNARLTTGERALIARVVTKNPRALELYFAAKAMGDQVTLSSPLADHEIPMRLLKEAVTVDPDFAQAHAQLSLLHSRIYGLPDSERDTRRRGLAEASLSEAKRLAPSAPETRMAEGSFAHNCEEDFKKALQIYEPLRSELPNDDELLYLIGSAQRQLGLHRESLAAYRQAVLLNPADLGRVTGMAGGLTVLRRFDELVALGEQERYRGVGPGLDALKRHVLIAAYELDRDREKLVRGFLENPLRRLDHSQAQVAYEAAMLQGDLPAAARALADERLTTMALGFFRIQPVSHHRALVAHLLGDRAAAAAHAAQARTDYRRQPLGDTRRARFTQVGLAVAAVCAGDTGEARRIAGELRKEIGDRIGQTDVVVLNEVGRVYALLGDREEGIAILRQLMTGPSSFFLFGTPNLIRLDPCWSRLASDPRFDAILNAAKPL